jgi:hypothetical protein
MVISGVAEKAVERLAQLVYLDTFASNDNQSLGDFQSTETWALRKEKTRIEGDGYKLSYSQTENFGVTNEDDLAWVKQRLSPHPFKTMLNTVRLRNPKGTQIPRTYIYCNHPSTGPFNQFANRLRTDETWHYRELATGYDAMITEPEQLVQLFLKVAEKS